MKAKISLAGCLAALFAALGCQPTGQTEGAGGGPDVKQVQPSPPASPRRTALNARDALFEKLSTRLVAAMSNGGPTAAISVCSREAGQIAAAVGQEFGVKIGRTSFKLRNPQNVPPNWARAWVQQRTSEPQFVDLPDGTTAALLPIRLKSQCLVCHGPEDQIAEDVRAQLAQVYPEDQATGFQEGDLRGWFWVEVPSGSQ